MKRPSELRIKKKALNVIRVNFVLKRHLLLQMNLSNSGLENRSIKKY